MGTPLRPLGGVVRRRRPPFRRSREVVSGTVTPVRRSRGVVFRMKESLRQLSEAVVPLRSPRVGSKTPGLLIGVAVSPLRDVAFGLGGLVVAPREQVSGEASTTAASYTPELSVQRIEIDLGDLDLSVGQSVDEIGPRDSGDLGAATLGDQSPRIPVDRGGKPDFLLQFVRLPLHGGEDILGQLDGHCRHGMSIDGLPRKVRPESVRTLEYSSSCVRMPEVSKRSLPRCRGRRWG